MSELYAAGMLTEPLETNQPKLYIANVAAYHGIKVPTRLESYEEAVRHVEKYGSVVDILPEHPDELDGVRLLHSQHELSLKSIEDGKRQADRYSIDNIDEMIPESLERSYYTGNIGEEKDLPGYGSLIDATLADTAQTDEDFRRRYIKLNYGQRPLSRYTAIKGVDAEDHTQDLALSYWVRTPGAMAKVIADSAVEDLYHVAIRDGFDVPKELNEQVGFTANSAGDVERMSYVKHDDYSGYAADKSALAELVATYNMVRGLPGFNSEHCPLVNFTLGDEGSVFLNARPTLNFESPGFTVHPGDYPSEDGWMKADHVRGFTPGGMMTLETALWYPSEFGDKSSSVFGLPESEGASYDHHHDYGLTENMRDRRVVIPSNKGFDWNYKTLSFMGGHNYLESKLFGTPCAMLFNEDEDGQLIPEDVYEQISEIIHGSQHIGLERVARALVEYVSDGHIGYARFNDDAESSIIIENFGR